MTEVCFMRARNLILTLIPVPVLLLTLSLHSVEKPDEKTKAGDGFFQENGIIYATSDTRFVLEADDANASLKYIEYRLDQKDFAVYKDPLFIPREGEHFIIYRGYDQAGNREANRSMRIIIDNSAPILKRFVYGNSDLSTGKLIVKKGFKVDLKAEDTWSGLKGIEISTDGKTWQNFSAILDFSQEGPQTLQYRAADRLGNSGNAESFTFLVDATPPVLTLASSQQFEDSAAGKITPRNNAIYLDARDEVSGVEKILFRTRADSPWVVYKDPILLVPSEFDGGKTMKFSCKAIDKVGNETPEQTLNLILDSRPPRSTLKFIGPDGKSGK